MTTLHQRTPLSRIVRLILVLAVAGLAATALLSLPGLRGTEARAADPSEPAPASGEVLVAGSICEAHELRALAAERPGVQIEIPPEYDQAYPSASACLTHELTWDPEAPGPMQPIPFSHAHHAGEYEIDCQYCHSSVSYSAHAGVPSVELCMGCHAQFSQVYDQEFEGIRILKEHWGHTYEQVDGKWQVQPRDPEQARPIEWKRIHWLPEHVQFKHNRHIAAGVECSTCHGNMEQMNKVYLVPDTIWWGYGLPAQKLEMGWCINCHRENQASQDCLTCHY